MCREVSEKVKSGRSVRIFCNISAQNMKYAEVGLLGAFGSFGNGFFLRLAVVAFFLLDSAGIYSN